MSNRFKAYAYDADMWESTLSKEYLIEKPATLVKYENAILLPLRYIHNSRLKYGDGLLEGGVCTNTFEFIAGLRRSHSTTDVNKNCVASYTVEKDSIDEIHETVIFGGILTQNFGHMLCDSITRLWYTAKNPDDQTRVAFLEMPHQTFGLWEFLEMAGIDRSRIIIVRKPTQFDAVIVPGETYYSLGSAGYRHELRYTLDAIRSNAPSSPYDKVYLTRSALAHSGCVGEKYFEDFFRSQGFAIVSPEKLSFKEQVSVIAGAKEIACTMGTLAYHALFAQPKTKLTVLNRSTTRVIGAIVAAAASGVQAYFVDIFKNLLPEEQAGLCIYLFAPTKYWLQYVQEVFGPHIAQDETLRADQYPLADKIFEYLKLWAIQYRDADRYRWIRNAMVPDIIFRINRYLLDYDIDKTSYGKPPWIERLQHDVHTLDKRLAIYRKASKNSRSNALSAEYAVFEEHRGVLIVSGVLESVIFGPRSGTGNLVLYFNEDKEKDGTLDRTNARLHEHADKAKGQPQTSVATGNKQIAMPNAFCRLPLTFSHEQDGRLAWSAKTGAKDADAFATLAIGQSLSALLELDVDGRVRTIQLALDPCRHGAHALSVAGMPAATCLMTQASSSNSILSVVSADKLAATPPACVIQAFCWEDDTLILSIRLRHPLANTDDAEFSIEIMRVSEGKGDDEMDSEVSAQHEECVFRTTLERGRVMADTVCACRCRMDFEKILAHIGSRINGTYYLSLACRVGTSSEAVSIPFGRRRLAGAFKDYKRAALFAGSARLVFMQDNNKRLGFRIKDITKALEKSAKPRITQLFWDDAELVMCGTAKHRFSKEACFEITLLLENAVGDTLYVPTESHYDTETKMTRWSIRFDPRQTLRTAATGKWYFALEKRLPSLQRTEPFSAKRARGTFKTYRLHTVDQHIEQIQSEKKVLGFEVKDTGPLFKRLFIH